MNTLRAPSWTKTVLIAAGAYNLVWGALAVFLPLPMLRWLRLEPLPTYPQLWQCIGMIVGVYGAGYLIAARDPYRHWPITLVGLLGKVLGPVGFATAAFEGALPGSLGWTIVTNDLIWWIPFAMILWGALRFHQSEASAYAMSEPDEPLRDLWTDGEQTLDELASQQPQLVVFLRHAGCTFCRESLAELSEQRKSIESDGCGIVLVHMGNNERDAAFFEKYALGDVPRIADPQCRLYRQFGLDLGSFWELLGLRVWLRGFVAGILKRHGVGRWQGNVLQLPGVFVYYRGQILEGFQHDNASARVDFAEFAHRAVSEVKSRAASAVI